MEPTIETPRLRLIWLHDTSLDSQHLQWFHQLWSDDEITAWSLHGKCHTIEESQQWMIEQLTKYNGINYAVFEKHDTSGGVHEGAGKLIGNMGLRTQDGGPTLPPFPPSSPSSASKPLNLRAIGYSFFQSAWGKGYATEAGRALISAYATSIAAKKDENFYIEAGWDKDNLASQRVLQKLGFREVGWKVEKEQVFLAGKWRDPGYWIYGMYLE